MRFRTKLNTLLLNPNILKMVLNYHRYSTFAFMIQQCAKSRNHIIAHRQSLLTMWYSKYTLPNRNCDRRRAGFTSLHRNSANPPTPSATPKAERSSQAKYASWPQSLLHNWLCRFLSPEFNPVLKSDIKDAQQVNNKTKIEWEKSSSTNGATCTPDLHRRTTNWKLFSSSLRLTCIHINCSRKFRGGEEEYRNMLDHPRMLAFKGFPQDPRRFNAQ